MNFPKTESKNYKINIFFEKTKTVVLAVLVLLLSTTPVFADQLSDINNQINAANSKLSDIRSQKNTLSNEIAEFDTQIYSVQLEINKTQAEINLTNQQISDTQAKIAQAEADLQKQKDLMKEYLRTMYIEGQTSTIELIATSNTFSDFIDKSQYLSTMQQHVQDTADKIVALKNDLDAKEKDLEISKEKSEQLRNSQVLQQQAVQSQKNAKDAILAQTKGSETNYQNLLNNLYAQRAALSAKNNETISGGSSGYPYATADPDGIDPWNFYFRQCTSYAAWRSAVNGPISASDLRKMGSTIPANGGDWYVLAGRLGYHVSQTPTAGSIMSFPYSSYLYYGHVAYVESVNIDGTVNISEYNWSIPLGFGRRNNVNPANYNAYFITR